LVVIKSAAPLISVSSFSHLSARPATNRGGARYDAGSVRDHGAFLCVEPVAHLSHSHCNTEALYRTCVRTLARCLTLWRCHNVWRQLVIPYALCSCQPPAPTKRRAPRASPHPKSVNHIAFEMRELSFQDPCAAHPIFVA